jgi:hypothetical protein
MATELLTWQIASLYAFLLRHREVFRVEPEAWPYEWRARHTAFLRYGIELDVLRFREVRRGASVRARSII